MILFKISISHFRLGLKVVQFGELVGIFQMAHNAKILTIFVLVENVKNLLAILEMEILINWTRQNAKKWVNSGRTELGPIGKNCQVVNNLVLFQERLPLSYNNFIAFFFELL